MSTDDDRELEDEREDAPDRPERESTGDYDHDRRSAIRSTIETAVRDLSTDDDTDKPKERDRDHGKGATIRETVAGAIDAGKQDPSTDDKGIVKPDTVPGTTDAPPKSWSKESRADWAKTPPSIRAEAHKRERDMANGVVKLQERAAAIEPHIQRAAPLFKRYGMDESAGLGRVVDFAHAIERRPDAAILDLIRDYSRHPGVAEIARRLGLSGQGPAGSQQSSQQNSQSFDAVSRNVDAWAADKPNYGDVRKLMGLIVAGADALGDYSAITDRTGKTITLDKVYRMAAHLRDALQKEQAGARPKNGSAAKQANGASRRSGGASNGVDLPKGASVKDHVRAAWRHHEGA